MNVQASQAVAIGLPVFDRLRRGHITFSIFDNSCAPLLPCGQVAVIDPGEVCPIDGGLFLVRSGGRQGRAPILAIRQTSIMPLAPRPGREELWCIASYNRPRNPFEHARATGHLHVCEAMLPIDYVGSVIVGRVVGQLARANPRAASKCHSTFHADVSIDPAKFQSRLVLL